MDEFIGQTSDSGTCASGQSEVGRGEQHSHVDDVIHSGDNGPDTRTD